MPVRAGEPSDAAFIVEMARLASVIEDRPLPPADDPELVQMLPLSPDTAVLALDHDGHPVGAAWWHYSDCPLVVTPDGAGPRARSRGACGLRPVPARRAAAAVRRRLSEPLS